MRNLRFVTLLYQKQPIVFKSSVAALTGTCALLCNETSTSSEASNKKPRRNAIIETDFTDKIASKPYLNYVNPRPRDSLLTSSIHTIKRTWGKFARNDRNPNVSTNEAYYDDSSSGRDAINDYDVKSQERPKGIPRKLRILAIDVPEFRSVLDGECRVNLSRVYPDDIAPPKIITKRNKSKSISSTSSDHGPEPIQENKEQNLKEEQKEKKRRSKEKMEVIQKSLARAMVRCRNVHTKRIGVEILEASVYDLNPHNMRRTYQIGSYRYDPGKYQEKGSSNDNAISSNEDMVQRRMSINKDTVKDGAKVTFLKKGERSHDRTIDRSDEIIEDNMNPNEIGFGGGQAKMQYVEKTVLAEDEDEMDAPWNQYAWIEEMQIRISGDIPFGASVERSSYLSRKLFGTCYRRTVKASRSFIHWFIPSFLSGEMAGGEEGIDGDFGPNMKTFNRASSKPHAVIADGSAMQRVPGSLRFLTKCCKEADVPLFIINDPRRWGGNTHNDVAGAAADMRKTIKSRMIANALTIREGSMFERGRLLGQLETETKWQFKDAGRRTRQAVKDAAARLEKERDYDWSNLDSKELIQRLVERNVISLQGEELVDETTLDAFTDICIRFVMERERKQQTPQQRMDN